MTLGKFNVSLVSGDMVLLTNHLLARTFYITR